MRTKKACTSIKVIALTCEMLSSKYRVVPCKGSGLPPSPDKEESPRPSSLLRLTSHKPPQRCGRTDQGQNSSWSLKSVLRTLRRAQVSLTTSLSEDSVFAAKVLHCQQAPAGADAGQGRGLKGRTREQKPNPLLGPRAACPPSPRGNLC